MYWNYRLVKQESKFPSWYGPSYEVCEVSYEDHETIIGYTIPTMMVALDDLFDPKNKPDGTPQGDHQSAVKEMVLFLQRVIDDISRESSTELSSSDFDEEEK